MAERRLGGRPPDKLSGKLSGKLGGRLAPYVPRGAQYDYKPPSVFARYKILTAVFVMLLLASFGYWAFILRQPRAAAPAPVAPSAPAPQNDPVYVEPLTPK